MLTEQTLDKLNAMKLGFALDTPEGLLRNFASHADRIGHRGPVTIALAVQWARSSRSSNPAQAARRLAVVRQFARYRERFDPATEVPPAGLLGRIPRRPPPLEAERQDPEHVKRWVALVDDAETPCPRLRGASPW